MFLKILFYHGGLVITPPAVKNLATPTPTDIYFDIYVERDDIREDKQIFILPWNGNNDCSHKCYGCGFNIRNVKQRDGWSSRYCSWSLLVRFVIMIRDYKICILVRKCNADKIDSEITIVTFVLHSIFPLYEYQYVSNHSMRYCSTFPYLSFVIPLLLIIVYNNLGLFRPHGMINGERRNGKNLEEIRSGQNQDSESYLQVRWIKTDQLDVTCFIISLFTAQHVSNVSTSIFRSLRLIVDLFHVLYCVVLYCTWNKSTISRKLLKMDVLTFETCWAVNSEIIKQVTSSWAIFIQLSRWCTVQ